MSANFDRLTDAEAVARCQLIFSHAWMVRTFVKHSEVVEDFPELMQIVRTVFDTSRALESKTSEPQEYLKTLRKKMGKLRAAATEFGVDAPQASDHENFRQAVISMNGCISDLEAILEMFPAPALPAMPPNFRLPTRSGTMVPDSEPSAVDEAGHEGMR